MALDRASVDTISCPISARLAGSGTSSQYRLSSRCPGFQPASHPGDRAVQLRQPGAVRGWPGSEPGRQPCGRRTCATVCNLDVLVVEVGEPVPAPNPDTCVWCGRIPGVRRAGSGAASGAADGRCSDRLLVIGWSVTLCVIIVRTRVLPRWLGVTGLAVSALYLLNQGDILATAVPGFQVLGPGRPDRQNPAGESGWPPSGLTILLRPAPATSRARHPQPGRPRPGPQEPSTASPRGHHPARMPLTPARR
jgi:hypothetical protein